MAFTGNFMCTSFKQEILQGVHNFTASTGDTFKLALYEQLGVVHRGNNGLYGGQRGRKLRDLTPLAAAR
jgi:hypothetical protein